MLQQSEIFHIAIIVLFLVVFVEASLSKIAARETPDWFKDQFASSWLGKLPTSPMWWTIALVELSIAVLFIIAAVQFEFKTGVANVFTGWGLLGSMFLFIMLCFGQRVSLDYAGAANSFYYAALSGLLWHVVSAFQ